MARLVSGHRRSAGDNPSPKRAATSGVNSCRHHYAGDGAPRRGRFRRQRREGGEPVLHLPPPAEVGRDLIRP